MKVVSIVGMAGSGKTEVARLLEENGFTRIRFGDVTDEEVEKRGLELNEKKRAPHQGASPGRAGNVGLCPAQPAQD